MSFGALVVLALGLAVDAAAVAAARGAAAARVRLADAVRVALLFGGAQAAMPLVGWALGERLLPFIEAWDHWVIFGVLAAIGGKLLLDARGADGDEPRTPATDGFGLRVLTLLAVATSVDALAVGVTLPALDVSLALAAATIGVVAAAASALGLYAGRRLGAALGPRLEILGGLALIGLGTKILVEHLAAR